MTEETGAQLVVLRGNSGSGKSAAARQVQERVGKGRCAVVGQDVVRRTILREPDAPGAFNVTLIETIATACLERGLTVVVEGILHADRYAAMLERLRHHATQSHFYAWDLSFAETGRRHQMRPQATEFGLDSMRSWFHCWNPLPFVDETRFDETWTLASAVGRICSDLCLARTVQTQRSTNAGSDQYSGFLP
ncbi:AAA family ATPase [Nocardia salmonicida]|uniref:AAA family ATPase n=1 Tax=Nocardia salmonicida TaxID=53431 RepID=UPI0012F52175|nr:AAA family ATPase [Nocardia salmonicida]MBC7299512.1 kinase [Nocardia sp.]